MKLVIIVPDGASDIQYAELDNKTPLQYAYTPAMDEIARLGQVGSLQTMYHDLPLGSLTAFLGFFGIDPHVPNIGRAAFEALSMGVELGPGDVVFRCNIVRVKDNKLCDFTAGQISDKDALDYISELYNRSIFDSVLEIHHSKSYRNIVVWRDCEIPVRDFELFLPHEHVGQHVVYLTPLVNDGYKLLGVWYQSTVGDLRLYPWGACKMVDLPQVPYRLFMVTALDFLSGLAQAVGGHAIIPLEATGYADTNYNAKLDAFKEEFAWHDVIFIHLNAPDEEAHLHRLEGKIKVIEDIDRFVGGVFAWLVGEINEPWRLVVVPDHSTLVSTGKHSIDPVPFCIMGDNIEASGADGFYERIQYGKEIVDQWRN